MADIEGEDGYSDDDLDTLESADFLRLQEQALNATQYPLQTAPRRGQPISIEGLGGSRRTSIASDVSVFDSGRVSPHIQYPNTDRKQRVSIGATTNGLTAPAAEANSYELHPTNSALPHRTGASQEGVAKLIEPVAPNDLLQAGISDGDAEDDQELGQKMNELLREKETWSREKASLRKVVDQARKDVLGKNGEIAVLRSKHTKQLQDHEKLYQSLQHQHQTLEESRRRDLEEARKEKERLVTHNRFLDHEIHDQAWQVRRSRNAGKGKEQEGLVSTPKRVRQQMFADGFEDDELGMRSPSKSTGSRSHTPRAGAKRKRNSLNASPAASPSKPHGSLAFVTAEKMPGPVTSRKPFPSLPRNANDGRSQFLHGVLNHRFRPGEPRLLEQLASWKLPSKPSTSLYELFLDEVPPMIISPDTEDVPATVGMVVLKIWSACLKERYYIPLKSLIELTDYVLLNGTMATAVRLMDDIVDLAQGTADINVIPRFKKLNKNAKVISANLHGQAIESSDYVDVKQCLDLLCLTAFVCAKSYDAMARFWHCMRFDFISMLLRVVQPMPDLICTLRLLKTCIRHDLLSAIKSQNTEGSFAEQHVMDRVTSMLVETPRPEEAQTNYDTEDVLHLRLEILYLLEKICEQKNACHTLAVHPYGVGRLVRIMNDELNAIYSNPMYKAERSDIISRSVRVLFHIASVYAEEIDLRAKLQQQPGGVNKFLITLARLAFSDATYYERDINEDAFDCAHQLLESFVTPEEAESLKAAFVRENT